ncbi:transcriptional regulator, MarR family [Albimonas donghaensis]|uniref:Transcriptional regulator, MarR family n=1 Tax=Albimonas donghaensis TaxID=356660 RepID=A0A1H2QCI5_9RHOB|nr:MarR family transcriptional regulator [Albimonas donghaensis]SDW04374.1 transcriptional regulator, MarR family [Albimonas donghaensis]
MDNASYARIRTPGHQIRRLHQVSVAVFHDCLQSVNLTPIQYTILVIIGLEPGLEQTTIAVRAELDTSTTGDVIKRLEKHGMIRREVGARDRRARVAYITPSGEEAITDAQPLIAEAIQHMLSPLDEAEQASMLEMIERILSYHVSHRATECNGKPWQRELKSAPE